MNNPQLAVIPNSHDSLQRGFGQALSASDPRWIVYLTGGVFKVGTNDSLWEYRSVTESDTSGDVAVQYGVGEITTDNGTTSSSIDLALRADTLKIDSTHSAAYMLRSERLTLPAQGSISYYRWVQPTDDSLYRARLDTIRFALDFYDTSGTFVCRLDSMMIDDTSSSISPALRSITVDRSHSQLGYVVFERTSGTLTGPLWQGSITPGRRSISDKRGIAKEQPSGLTLSASPNPLTYQTRLTFSIPQEGAVSVRVLDVLGRTVTELVNRRIFHAGAHTLQWHTSGLPAGVYLAEVKYGNTLTTIRLSVLK